MVFADTARGNTPPSGRAAVPRLRAFAVSLCLGAFLLPQATSIRAEEGTAIPIMKTWEGFNSKANKPKAKVIRSQGEWREAWTTAHGNSRPVPEVPNIDFEREMILAVFMGGKSTGGYEVQIRSVTKSAGELTVAVRHRVPGPDEVTTSTLTSPYYFAAVPKVDMPSTKWVYETVIGGH